MEASETLAFTVTEPETGVRLDQFLAQTVGWSRARLQKLLKSDLVLVNGRPRPASYRVRSGDGVVVSVPEPSPSHLAPEALPLTILFEDQDLLVVNKPPGLVVHPCAGHRQGTLLNALVHHCPELKDIGEVSRPGLVHRLDKDTSGEDERPRPARQTCGYLLAGHQGIFRPPFPGGAFASDRAYPSTPGPPGLGRPPGPGRCHLRGRGEPPGGPPKAHRS